MTSRIRVALCGAGFLLCIFFAVLLVVAPPDGAERGDWSQFIGRFHPLMVHLPIAFVLLAALLECAGRFRPGAQFRPFAGLVLALAAVTAVLAMSLGWLLARSGGYEGQIMTRHMWGGVILAGLLVMCCAIREWNGQIYNLTLFAAVCLLAWTADQGGKLTHGPNFLIEHMPGSLRSLMNVPAPAPTPALPVPDTGPLAAPAPTPGSPVASPATPESVAFFALRVEPIFEDKCNTCHGPEKKKGKLRLDSFEYVMAGGKDGQVVKPGDPKGSDLIRRVTLPRDHKDAMPAEGKPALSDAQIKVIEFWIASGAAKTVAVEKARAAPPPPKPEPVLRPTSPDYHPRIEQIQALQAKLGLQLVPRSQDPHDGLILRTVSAPDRCNDAALEALKPIADLIVDAELARTKVTDAGMKALGSFPNLVSVDLSHTAVSSRGLAPLENLKKLESLNVSSTKVDNQGLEGFRHKPGLHHLYSFEAGNAANAKSDPPARSADPKSP
jgi:uncharacterized membrane protein/mono/diheme cytochrome c family protein